MRASHFRLMKQFCCRWLRFASVLVLAWSATSARGAEPAIDFNRQIRPILSDKCFTCHGPDANQRDSALRLDQQEAAFSDLGGYHAIVPGKPDQSALAQRILSDDDDTRMPPPDQAKQLTPEEKQLLVRWIEGGAIWRQHWSFEPLRKPSLPELAEGFAQGEELENFIDHWLLAGLTSRGWKFSDRADSRTLYRRLAYDLTGLPPDPSKLEAFVADPHSDAYERAVDEFLASPHFGERMAVYWLDLVRYADSVGFHGDQDVSVTPYRDYVIDSFNRNVPFDQFTIEQLAGDLLPDATQRQKIASGYNRLGMMSAEGGVQPKEYLAKYAADRVRNAASVWLGITLGCAECHDHKYDPFTTEDFYRFAAFFADIQEQGLYSSGTWGPSIEVADPELETILAPIDQQLARLQAEYTAPNPTLASSQQAWENDLRQELAKWRVAKLEKLASTGGVTLESLDDGSVRAHGESPAQAVYTAVFTTGNAPATGLRLEALPDDSLPKRGPGRAGNGNFVVSELVVLQGDQTSRFEEITTPVNTWSAELQALRVPIVSATASIEQELSGKDAPYQKWSAAAATDLDQHGITWGWAILPEVGQPHELLVEFSGAPQPRTESSAGTTGEDHEIDNAQWTLVIFQNHDNPQHTMGRFRVSTASAGPIKLSRWRDVPADIQQIIATDPATRTAESQEKLREYYRQVAPETETLRAAIAQLEQQRKSLVDRHTRSTLITVSVEPRTMRVLHRGNWMDDSGAVVTPGIPSYFSQLKSEKRPTRLDLAQWLTASDNPMTSRVMANRLWKLFFGVGISRTLDDIGAQGEPPVHPELLDSLAVELVESGWDLKHLIKLIVMSRAYQQTSRATDELRQADPYNRYVARQSRFRLDAEFLRDNALAASGLLISRVGGGNAKPYQPPGLYRHLNFPQREYVADVDENQYRRGVYTHWQRQYLHPAMKTFDAPAREECTAERPRSNTPLGALVLLNDPSYVEAARVLATKTIQEMADDTERLQFVFRRSLQRSPSDQEREILLNLVRQQREYFAQHEEEAKRLVEVGLSRLPDDVDYGELAAWTAAVRAVFNMVEFTARY
jgi:hypothetical protein